MTVNVWRIIRNLDTAGVFDPKAFERARSLTPPEDAIRYARSITAAVLHSFGMDAVFHEGLPAGDTSKCVIECRVSDREDQAATLPQREFQAIAVLQALLVCRAISHNESGQVDDIVKAAYSWADALNAYEG